MSRMVVFALLTVLLWQEVVCRSTPKSWRTELPKNSRLEIFMQALPHFRRVLRDTGVVSEGAPGRYSLAWLEEFGVDWLWRLPMLVFEKMQELLETEHCVERILCETSLGKGLFTTRGSFWMSLMAELMGILGVFPERFWQALTDVGHLEVDASCRDYVCSIFFY